MIDWTKPVQYVPLSTSQPPYELTVVGKHGEAYVCWNPKDRVYYRYVGTESYIRNKPPEPATYRRWLVLWHPTVGLHNGPWCVILTTPTLARWKKDVSKRVLAIKEVTITEGEFLEQ